MKRVLLLLALVGFAFTTNAQKARGLFSVNGGPAFQSASFPLVSSFAGQVNAEGSVVTGGGLRIGLVTGYHFGGDVSGSGSSSNFQNSISGIPLRLAVGYWPLQKKNSIIAGLEAGVMFTEIGFSGRVFNGFGTSSITLKGSSTGFNAAAHFGGKFQIDKGVSFVLFTRPQLVAVNNTQYFFVSANIGLAFQIGKSE
jgi:hypothetical protein